MSDKLDSPCPMCRKHKTIVFKNDTWGVYKGDRVRFEEVSYFCPLLELEDEDGYFVPARAMEENMARLRDAYHKSKVNKGMI